MLKNLRFVDYFHFRVTNSTFLSPFGKLFVSSLEISIAPMLKFRIIILALLLAASLSASAQRVALDERIPKIKSALWLDDKAPEKSQYTYIEFTHSRTVPCQQTLLRIRNNNHFNENMRAVIITNESPEQISAELRKCAGGYVHVAFDKGGEIFRNFDVQYVPFGIVIDHRRKALWFGNPITLKEDFLDKITTQNNDTH